MSDAAADRLNEALELFRKGKYSESTKVLEAANKTFGSNFNRDFCIGRNFLMLGDLDEARKWLRKSVAAKATQWNLYQLCVAEDQSGNVVEAAQSALRFMENGGGNAGGKGYKDAHGEIILRIADAAHAQHPALAASVLQKAEANGVPNATRRLARLQGKPAGGKASGNAAVDAGPPDASDSPRTMIEKVGRWIERDKLTQAERALDDLRPGLTRLAPDEIAQILELEHQFATRGQDVARAATLIGSFEFARPGEHIDPAVLAAAERLRAFVEAEFTPGLTEVNGLLRYFTRRRMGPEAYKLLDGIADEPVFANPQTIVRRLEFLCVMADYEAAEILYRDHFAGREVARRERGAAIRFLAERKRWEEAAQIVRQALLAGHPLPGEGFQMLRIARRAHVREEFLDMIEAAAESKGPRLDPSVLALRQMLIDDLCVEIGSAVLPGGAEAEPPHRLSDRNGFLSSQEREGAAALRSRTALYMCSDRNYLFSALTFLASYAAHNSVHAGKVKLFVFLGDDVPPEWDRVVQDLGAKLRHPIEVVREKDFVSETSAQHGSWGFFTGGSGLSRAAYFRLYAALYLERRGEFDRLCYIDSDIICQSNLAELFDYELNGRLIGACREDAGPLLHFVADRISIDRDDYFNSGVLLFDISRRQTLEHVDQAIHLSEHEPHRLFFLDQCALNIAFENKVCHLPPSFNYFIRPFRGAAENVGSAKLLHFVSAPKPWDIAYEREGREWWSRHAEIVRLLLNPADFRQVVVAANGGQAQAPAVAKAEPARYPPRKRKSKSAPARGGGRLTTSPVA